LSKLGHGKIEEDEAFKQEEKSEQSSESEGENEEKKE